MKGVNELRINQATMVEAVQFWLNSQMTTPPKVRKITKNSSNYTDEFIVEMESITTDEEVTA